MEIIYCILISIIYAIGYCFGLIIGVFVGLKLYDFYLILFDKEYRIKWKNTREYKNTETYGNHKNTRSLFD